MTAPYFQKLKLSLCSGVLFFAVNAATATEFTLNAPEDLVKPVKNSMALSEVLRAQTPDPTELIAAAQADYRRILATLYDQGYYAPKISIQLDGREAADFGTFDNVDAVSKLAVTVDPGPKFTFSRASVTPIASEQDVPEGFRSGQPARSDVMRETAEAVINGWRREGYAKADLLNQDITADHTSKTVDARLTIAPGRKLTFGKLILKTPSAVRPIRIITIAGIPEGRPFSPEELDKASERLRKIAAFRAVQLTEAETANPDGSLDIEAVVSDQKPRRITFGVEAATLDGGSLSAAWMHRNLMGGAETFILSGKYAGIGSSDDLTNYNVGVYYERPATLGADSKFYSSLVWDHEEIPSYATDTVKTEIGMKRKFGKYTDFSFAIGYDRTIATENGVRAKYTLWTFPLTATYDDRENKLDPVSGTYLGATITPFVTSRGKDYGMRATLDGRRYFSLSDAGKITLALRGQAKTVITTDGAEVPPTYLFYSGGGGTVRGHKYQSLGITSGGSTTGARTFLGASAEVRAKFNADWGAVAFYDFGLVAPQSLSLSDAQSHAGAGVGLRYATPLGPLRLDVAVPVQGATSGRRAEIYVGIGQAF